MKTEILVLAICSGLGLTMIGCVTTGPYSPGRIAVDISNRPTPSVVAESRKSKKSKLVAKSGPLPTSPLVSSAAKILPVKNEEPAPLENSAEEYSYDLDFGTALSLVSGNNPQVAFARVRINEAFAQWQAAKVLWLPSIRTGISYNKHEGQLQNSTGRIVDVSRSSLQSGLGVGSVGAGSPPIPGLSVRFHFADAIFQPLIARRTVAARKYAATATNNDLLLDAALAYLELLRAVEEQKIAEETIQHTKQLAELTRNFSQSGQGPQADADRAQAELSLRENNLTRAGETIQVASFRLAEILSLDGIHKITPTEPTVTPINLISVNVPVQDLVATALANRPELSQSRLLVAEAVGRLKREKYAPLIPSVLLGLSYGGFGGGVGGTINSYQDRLDFDAVAFWEVRNLGFGEKAARNEAYARVHQAQLREVQVMDRVAREVAEANVQVQSRKKQISVAESGIKAAEASYTRNLERIRQGQGLPIEVLQSIQALDEAHREYLQIITDYNESQFRLYRALGSPIQGIDANPEN
ncbi:MAG: TolC family protein [Planctomycetes bacterium]|nr:TolC family protein [Planctomycetota bacterium]